jgi:hypothetical protein
MKQTLTQSTPMSCSAELTVRKNSIKKYFNNYYLQNGQEFELLLKNTTQDTVIATIEINGKKISTSAIVLKPGQKVYLERYLDQNKKFLFETYQVDNTIDNQVAIANNGKIRIAFYREKQIPVLDWSHSTTSCCSSAPIYNSRPSYNVRGIVNSCYSSTGTTSGSISYSSTLTSSANPISTKISKSLTTQDSLETGMVGQGSASNQEFKNYQGDFEPVAFKVVEFKIYPHSAKPLDVNDLATYCTECGTKNKKGNYKFCPKCGNRF